MGAQLYILPITDENQSNRYMQYSVQENTFPLGEPVLTVEFVIMSLHTHGPHQNNFFATTFLNSCDNRVIDTQVKSVKNSS